jgi:hypothetical protein
MERSSNNIGLKDYAKRRVLAFFGECLHVGKKDQMMLFIRSGLLNDE